jgi:hypothetical protein
MRPRWDDVELSFDEAAERMVAAHARDGKAVDLPITDLKTWAVTPQDGQFALVPLARHHEPTLLRNNAFSNLMARLGPRRNSFATGCRHPFKSPPPTGF